MSQLTSLALRAEDMERENTRLREERDQARQSADGTVAALKAAEQQIAALHNDHGGVNRDRQHAEQEIEGLRRNNEGMQRELTDLRTAAQDLQNANGALQNDLRNGEMAMTDARGMQETLGMRDRDIEGLNMELRTLKGDMAQDVNRLEAEAAKATARLRQEADALRTDLIGCQSECQGLHATLAAVKSEKNAVMEQSMHDKDSLLSTMKELEAQVVQLREMKAAAEQHAVILTSRVAELEAINIQTLQQRDNNDALRRGEIQLLQEQLERCERERLASLEVQKEMQAMDEEMGVIHTRLTAKLKERDEAMAIANQELMHLKSEHAASLEAQKCLQTRLRQAMEEREVAEACMREDIRRLKEQLTAAEEEVFRSQHRERTAVARAEEEMEQMAADLMRSEERTRLLEHEKVEDNLRYKNEVRALEDRLSEQARHVHELERTIETGREEMARACEKHAHEMTDMQERLARDHEKAAKLIAELEGRLAECTIAKDNMEIQLKDNIERLKEELRVAEEAVYRTERELFHQGEQHKEAAEGQARLQAEELRMREGLNKDVIELQHANQMLMGEKAELIERLAAKERMLTDELHAVETAAKEEIKHLDEELRSVRRWAAEECYSAEEVAQLRDRVMATEASMDRVDQDRRAQLDAAHHKLSGAEAEIRRLTSELETQHRALTGHAHVMSPPR